MASFAVTGLDTLALSIDQLANMPETVINDILNAQADIIVSAQKSKANEYGVVDTREMINSIKKGKVKKVRDSYEIKVVPQGSRKRGKTTTTNAEIAYINEYGKRGLSARPFIRDANAESEPKIEKAALEVYDSFLKSKNL